MIGRLRGTLVALSGDGVVVDVGGVGYEIGMTPRGVARLPGMGEQVVLHTHLHVREDAMVIYGFDSDSERDLFRVLLGASGVGPKLAMAILGSLSQEEVRRAVASEDFEALTAVPGVGKRSAQKLVLELKPKIAAAEAETVTGNTSAARVREALAGLGYASSEIREVLASLPADAPVDEQLRRALQDLGKR